MGNSEYRVGIYTRISVEENIKSLADSIHNQKSLLSDYIYNKGLTITRIYEDEGETGGNYNRPAFKQMLQDIKGGIINCVVVKDLSRLGREYIETGEYIEKFFPEHNVRFISVFECIDSFDNPERMHDIDIPIINIFNEDYLKRTSKSTKSILNVKRRDGEFVSALVPYGYMRSPHKKNHLSIDEETKDVVVRIYEMYLAYSSMKAIADTLNAENVASPMVRRKQLRGVVHDKPSCWRDKTICNILQQEIYTGDMVQGKTKSYSYKVKKRIPLSREEWTIVPNTHEAIIDEDVFQTVQDMMKLKSKPMSKKHNTKPSILNGLLVCKECGKKLQRTIVKKDSLGYYYYNCSTYKNLGKSVCSAHALSEDTVINTILVTLNTLIDNMVDIEKAMKDNNQKLVDKVIQKTKCNLDRIVNDLDKCLKAKSCLYIDYTSGDINKTDYLYMVKEFDKNSASLETKKKLLEKELYDYNHKNLFNNQAFNTYTKHKGISVLTRKVVVDLIQQITIDRENCIKIIFKFSDEIKKYQYNL